MAGRAKKPLLTSLKVTASPLQTMYIVPAGLSSGKWGRIPESTGVQVRQSVSVGAAWLGLLASQTERLRVECLLFVVDEP
jgi:hypothetical protein